MRTVLLALLTTLAAGFAATSARAQAAPTREASVKLHCMPAAEWVKETVGRKLLDPFQCMRDTAIRHQAEALGVRFCEIGEVLFYEIKLLTQSGRVQKVLVDAASGRPHSGVIEK